MILTVAKLGTGTDGDPYRPDSDASKWVLVDETDTLMTIEVLD